MKSAAGGCWIKREDPVRLPHRPQQRSAPGSHAPVQRPSTLDHYGVVKKLLAAGSNPFLENRHRELPLSSHSALIDVKPSSDAYCAAVDSAVTVPFGMLAGLTSTDLCMLQPESSTARRVLHAMVVKCGPSRFWGDLNIQARSTTVLTYIILSLGLQPSPFGATRATKQLLRASSLGCC